MKFRLPMHDPRYAHIPWGRFWRLMRFMGLMTFSVIMFAVILLYNLNGWVSIHFYVATILGIGVAMILMSVLMGLVFISGHSPSEVRIAAPRPKIEPEVHENTVSEDAVVSVDSEQKPIA